MQRPDAGLTLRVASVGPQDQRLRADLSLATEASHHGAHRVVGRPGHQIVHRPRVHHVVDVDPTAGGSLAAVGLPVKLSRRMRVGVDGEDAAGLDGEPQQSLRWIEPLGPRVDLDRDPELRARGEDQVGVEVRLGDACRGRPSQDGPVQ